jgi:hypothetical protein
LTDACRMRSAMRSGEWLPTQWIARVAFGLGTEPWGPAHAGRALRALRRLEREGAVEQRFTPRTRQEELAGVVIRFDIPRREWRLCTS